MSAAVEEFIRGLDVVMLIYLVGIDFVLVALAVIGWRAIDDYVRRRPLRDYDAVARSPLSPPISIIAPAYNEELSIVASVSSLLQCKYAKLEVLVVNDGSMDGTLDRLREAFDLVVVERIPRARLATERIHATYASRSEPRLTVLDKDNGGKIVKVETPPDLLVNIQILEYLRAFLLGRIAWSRLGMLLIISGAFGLFRREAIVEVGGYDTKTVGEDAELVLRLHRYRREHGLPCRITFFPDPICWTEAPSSLRVLIRQRDRWQRGLTQMLATHRKMVGRPRYRRVGLVRCRTS